MRKFAFCRQNKASHSPQKENERSVSNRFGAAIVIIVILCGTSSGAFLVYDTRRVSMGPSIIYI